jgi:outer membrane protein assembly factor BamA
MNMRITINSAVTGLLFVLMLLLVFPPRAKAMTVENGSMDWAYGWVVDSITVTGTKKTRPIVILREMETRPGDALNQHILDRDLRYIGDLGLFANIEVHADSVSFGHCNLRLEVLERSRYFFKLIYPILEYDFNRKEYGYGVKWNDKNFRGRKESLNLTYKRDSSDDDNASFGWFAPWIGWRRISLNFGLSYFHRGETPAKQSILERTGGRASIALPLTDSRITRTQVISSLAVDRLRLGSLSGEKDDRVFVSPLLGFVFDNRNSPLKPDQGQYFATTILFSRAVTGRDQLFYRLNNDVRVFRKVVDGLILGVQSNLSYQFGEYPDYVIFGIGGSGTVRGLNNSKFRGAHRWYQSGELRYALLPKKVFEMPLLGFIDIGLGVLVFADAGVVWDRQPEFGLNRFHSGFGVGLRLYSPYQDVVRLDLGFNRHGSVYPYFTTGIRF